MHRGYPAFTDVDGTMREIVIIGYDHSKYVHIKEPLPDGTRSVDISKCYTYTKTKVQVRKELMKVVFSRKTPYREPLEDTPDA
jgi:hypothetical protein